jgi:hypothetical protein
MYAGLGAGNTSWTGSWAFTSLPNVLTLPLNAAGIADLNTSLATGQMTFGIVRGSTNLYFFGKYNDTAIANIPQLEVTYGFPCSGTPTAGVASAPTSICSGVSFDLSIPTTTATGVTYQWQSSTDGISYANIVGATTVNYTLSETTATYYQCVLTCTASGLSANSNVLNVTLNPIMDCHCLPVATNCSLDDVITNVIIATINNTTACSPNGYSYYTTPNPVLYQGQTYHDSITVGPGGTEYVGVWIDYNQNGTFDSLEFTDLGSGNGVQIDSSFTIPLTATVGSTKMRVRVRYNIALTGADACTTYTYGETEDYLVNIQTPMGINETILNGVSIYPNPTTGIFNVSISSINSNQLSIIASDVQGRVVYSISDKNVGNTYNKQIDLRGLSKGIYLLKLNNGTQTKVQKIVIQ